MRKSKIAVITGGSKGIGFRIAEALAKKKYNLVICSRKLTDAIKAKKKLETYGIKCLAVQTDISNYNQCKLLVRNAIKKFSRIDLLVNNAGIQGPIGYLWQNNVKEWENTIQINLIGVFYMCHLVVPHMLKQRKGEIINLSGGGSVYARPSFSAYACSKTAILRLTETLHEELKDKNILVFAIAPGATWTKMTKQVLEKKKRALDKKTIKELKLLQISGGTSLNKLENLVYYLIRKSPRKLSGKLIHVNELTKISKKGYKLNSLSGLLRRVDYN